MRSDLLVEDFDMLVDVITPVPGLDKVAHPSSSVLTLVTQTEGTVAKGRDALVVGERVALCRKL